MTPTTSSWSHTPNGTDGSTRTRLLDLLKSNGARYRLIAHPPEGRTEVVSELRGHPLEQAAKCIITRATLTKKNSRYVLAVVPGDRRVDLGRIQELCGARRVSFADRATAERLSGCVSGSIVPFAFDPALELMVDPDLLVHEEIFFNAADLALSVALNVQDYVRIAAPRREPIGERATVMPT
ncbi:YbaK/EbsC family protein [Streptomyces sp. NPDC050388]|uniref:YbaK/EbsC family protein n=1 Tax=Streptomyces sp. NPDC050388 TaxID=3155781 RepID=UPI00343FF3F3